MIETTEVRAEPRSPVPLVCAVAGFAALAVAQLNVLGQVWFVGLVQNDAAVYTGIAVLVVALLAWHLWPRRSWGVLLVAGSMCALPTPVLWLAEDAYEEWMLTPYLVFAAAALPLLLVGTLGAATATWRTGRRGAGAALLGATLAVRPLTGLSIASLALGEGTIIPVTMLVVLVATILSAVAAIVSGPAPLEPEPRPGWQVTIGGALAGSTPALLYHLWPAPEQNRPEGDFEGFYTAAGEHYLVLGLVMIGIGLLTGAAAGLRVLVAGVAAGLLLGALSSVVWPIAQNLYSLPEGGPALLALGAAVAAVLVAVWRARLVVGAAGVGVLVAGLLVLWSNLRADDPFLDADAVNVVILVLMVVTIIAATSTLASLGAGLASPGEAPAAFAGVTAAVAFGIGDVTDFLAVDPSADVPDSTGSYLPVIACLVVAVALTVLAHRLWQDREVPAAGMPAGPQ